MREIERERGKEIGGLTEREKDRWIDREIERDRERER